MSHTTVLNCPVYQSFVHPELSKQLIAAGLEVCCAFRWIEEAEGLKLFTFVFDPDFYYEQAYANVDFCGGDKYSIPAFQMMDLEALLPNYYFSNTNGSYELMCEGLELEPVQDVRLPDAFAKMVLTGIRKRKINTENAINFLHERILKSIP
jgi:hypothetical protein